ncbi:Uncharacterised protein [Vibrio cholerae]|nr:Uncharacterised protein [Vibrio cholerae]
MLCKGWHPVIIKAATRSSKLDFIIVLLWT